MPDSGSVRQANSGDSRAVLSVGGEAKAMSYDHKPTNKGENSRIVAAGGFVEFGRVNGEFFENAKRKKKESGKDEADPIRSFPQATSPCPALWEISNSSRTLLWMRSTKSLLPIPKSSFTNQRPRTSSSSSPVTVRLLPLPPSLLYLSLTHPPPYQESGTS